MDHDSAAHRLASGQHGLISRSQAREIGFTGKAIRHRVDRGLWDLLRPSVYRIAGSPASWEQQVLSGILAAGDFALASHSTAAQVWRLPLPVADCIEITTPLERRIRIAGIQWHRSGVFTVADCTAVARIPVTSAARAIFDMSSRFDDSVLGTALDEGLRRGVISLSAMHRLATRLPGIAPGRSPKRVQRLLESRIPGYDPGGSELESRVRHTLIAAGIPMPAPQYVVVLDGKRFVLDFAYPEQRIAIEVDGFDFHRMRTVFDNDRSRQNLLVLAGWVILRFTSHTADAEIVESVRQSLFGHEMPL